MERAVEIFVLINFLVIGLSHTFQAQAWVDFFRVLRSHGKVGSLINGFLSLTFGSIIVSFHWVWEGIIPTIITGVGIAQIIKSIVAFVFPAIGLKSMQKPMATNPKGYQVAGIIFLILTAILAYHLFIENLEY
ncbi:MAG: hypothetical protein ACOYXT_29970 [Bacteroidota bacterium]